MVHATGIASIGIQPSVEPHNLDLFLDRLDRVQIPYSERRRSVEIPLIHDGSDQSYYNLQGDTLDSRTAEWARELGDKVNDRGYQLVFIGFNPGNDEQTAHMPSASESERQLAVTRSNRRVDFASLAQGEGAVICGPWHIKHQYKEGDLQNMSMVDSLLKAGRYGASRGVKLCLEGIRQEGPFETNWINGLGEAQPVIEKVNDGLQNPVVLYHLDHSHEEKLYPGIDHVQHAKKAVEWGLLGHVHLGGEANRGPMSLTTPIGSQVPAILQSYKNAGYKGWVNLEGFHPDLCEFVGAPVPSGSEKWIDEQKAGYATSQHGIIMDQLFRPFYTKS